jgi:hypothetical protein
VLAGLHVGCIELFAQEGISGISELKAGLIKSTPQKIIADGTDWLFLDELKRELKA